jgi:nitroreductase
MSALEIIQTRRSIRTFLKSPISVEDAVKILDAGRLAPSGFNRQNWEFVYVNNPQVLRMIKNCAPGFYGDAAAAIVLGIKEQKDEYEKERRKAFHRGESNIGALDIGFAAENILLAAHALGLGGCAIASFNDIGVRKVINAPEDWKPLLIISLGYPDTFPRMPFKKKLSEIIHHNRYGNKWEVLKE